MLVPASPTSHPSPLPIYTGTKEHLRNISSLLEHSCDMQQETPQKKTSVVEGNGAGPAMKNCINATSMVPPFTDSIKVEDQKIEQNWEERYIALQNFLKKCDEKSTHDDYLQKLRQLSSAELSMCAAELERRAIELDKEEEIERQRMKELKIFENSADIIGPSKKTPITKRLIPKNEK